MKKLAAVVLFLVAMFSLQASELSENDFKQISLSNNINVLFYENFRSPAVCVQVTYHVNADSNPLNKGMIRQFIAENLINEKMHNRLKQIGAVYNVSWDCFGVHLLTQVSSENLKKLFSLIYEIASQDNIEVSHLANTKSVISINRKLAEIYKSSAVDDNIMSIINKMYPYDESSLNAITKHDVEEFFKDNFRDCHISVIVCGAVGYKGLLKISQESISNLPSRKAKTDFRYSIKPVNCKIFIENKYVSNGVYYMYYAPTANKKDVQIFWRIFEKELFKFMMKANRVLSSYSIRSVDYTENLYIVRLQPKSVIPIEQVKKLYESFVHRMRYVSLTPERIAEIAQLVDVENKILFSDLEYIRSTLARSYLGISDLGTEINASREILNISPEKIKSIANAVLINGPTIEVKTQFNSGM